ncbi:MAG: hypothetical protein U0869_12215 [Chloroflexota bacterium]
MARHARRPALLASALLALPLVLVPAAGALAAEPSATDPVASINGLLDALVGKDFGSLGGFICADRRAVLLDQLDLPTGYQAIGVDATAFLAALQPAITDRSVTLVSQDATSAEVAITGTLSYTVDDAALRDLLKQVLGVQGLDTSDASIDENLPDARDQLQAGLDLASPDTTVMLEDGHWVLCDDFAGIATTDEPLPSLLEPSAAPAVEPSAAADASLPPMDPAALAGLLAVIPEPLRSNCAPDSMWQVPDLGPEPGEVAAVDCDPDGSGGEFVHFARFDAKASMDAFYDTQLQGMKNLGAVDGPGCPDGPGEATWEHGRRFCFQPFGNDANMRWTYDDLAITASAIDDDGDWAALEAFFRSAGPVDPAASPAASPAA